MTEQQRKDIIKYRIRKARETFNEVDVLIENEFWNTAVNRIYYACFYAVTALLNKEWIQYSNSFGNKANVWFTFCKNRTL